MLGLPHMNLHAKLLSHRSGHGTASYASRFCLSWSPVSLQVHLTGLLTLELDGEPVIEATSDAQGTQLDGCLADQVARTRILIEYRNDHVVADVLHINIEDLIPFWRLSGRVDRPCPHLLMSSLDLAPGVHLAEPVSVTRKFGLYYA